MAENQTVKTMVESIATSQKAACENMARILAGCGDKLGSGDLEALANAMTLMATARRTLEQMAEAAKKALEGEGGENGNDNHDNEPSGK